MDWKPLSENILGHTITMAPGPHEDGRWCVWHQRLNAWCFDNDKECLRDHEGLLKDYYKNQNDRTDMICAWTDYRKDYGVSEENMDVAHKAFKAGWKAAKEGPQDGVLR